MQKSIMDMEVNHQKSDSATSTSRHSGMLVRINSIAIDLGTVVEEEAQPHEHFSIRGYVLGMRKKDRKHCLPFAARDNDGDLEENLPPLYVPRFRRWQCLNCVPDIEMELNTEDIMMGQSPVPISKERKITGTNAPVVDGDKVHIPTAIADDKHGSCDSGNSRNSNHGIKGGEDIKDKEACKATFDSRELNLCQTKDTNINAADALESRNINSFDRSNLRNDTGDLGHTVEISDKAINADKTHAIGILSVEVDNHENSSSGSDVNSNGLSHRRKPKKLRYLAEIMDEERIPVNDHPNMSASSSGMHAASAELAVSLPQVHVNFPEHIVKGIRTPQRKVKITQEENEIPLEISYPTSLAKKFRTSESNTEKIFGSIGPSDSVSEGRASTELGLQLDTKAQKNKFGKSKLIDISKKKRQMSIDYGCSLTVPEHEVPKIISTVSTGLQEYNVAIDTRFCKSIHVPTTLGQMEPFFGSSQCAQQTQSKSKLSKNKRSEIEAAQHLLIPSKSVQLGECSVKEKVALDLSLNCFMGTEGSDNDQSSFTQQESNHRKGLQRKEFLWDLNERIPHKTAMLRENLFSTLPDKLCVPLEKTLDISSSGTIEKTGERREHLEVSSPQTDTRIEHRASDDIPMDIVELMAKNQHERALSNSKKCLLPDETNRPFNGFSSVQGNCRPVQTYFPFACTRSSSTVLASDHAGFSQGSSISFPHLNTTQFNMEKLEENRSRFFCSFPQNQMSKTKFSVSGSITGSGAETIWPPRRETMPINIGVSQKSTMQSNNMGMHSFSDQRHKGKTISDIRENLAPSGKSLLKQGIIEPSPKSMGSLDPYSNDTIPAMQLLSLMDQGMISSSFNVGAKSFLDKPFSPCNHHPKFNREESQSLLSRSLFSQHHSKEPSWFRAGVQSAGESSKKPTSSLNCQVSYKYLEQEALGRPKKSESSKVASLAIRDSCFGMDKQKSIFGTSGPMVLPQQSFRHEGPSGTIDLEAPSNLSTPRPLRRNSEIILCTLNRNPAEFSMLDPQNKYTIGAKDLKFRKRDASKERTRSIKVTKQTSRRFTKDAPGKEYAKK